MSRYVKPFKLPPLHLYDVGDQVFVLGPRGTDPKPYRIFKLLPDAAYELSRDGVCDNNIYREEDLTSARDRARDLARRYKKTNAKKDPQDSIDNVAVVARPSAMPIKKVEVNTADNDSLPHHTLTYHSPWQAETPGPDEPDLEELEWNPPLGVRSSSPMGRGQVASEVAPTASHIRQTAFEDSAYGTASHGQFSGVKGVLPTKSDAVERQIDDSSTEYSNISMMEWRSDTYMECFADDLYAVASKVRCDPQSIQTLSGRLPELLQQFALRIGQEVPHKDGREVMFYVYKHRK